MRSWRVVVVLLACIPGIAQAQSWPDLASPAPVEGGGENDAAVIVAIEHYPFVAPVPGALRNADDWHLFLTRTRGVPLSRVRLLRDNDGSLEQMKSEIERAARTVKPGGTLWFIFIGHGAPASTGQDGLLVGMDAQQRADSITARSLGRKELLSMLGKGGQAQTVVVLDACFSGRTSSGDELVKGLQPLVPVKQLAPASKALVFTAAQSDQFAGPLPAAERPAFSYLMLGALRGWADTNRDGKVSAQEVSDYVHEALLALVKDRNQTPGFEGRSAQAVLVAGAHESGPDLGALVRARPAFAIPATLPVQKPRPFVTAAMNFGNGKAYFFFSNGIYVRYDMATDRVDDGFPLSVADNWHGVGPYADKIVGVYKWSNGKTYFILNNGQYLRYDNAKEAVDPSYPAPMNDANWPGIGPLGAHIGSALFAGGKTLYVFAGGVYGKYSFEADHFSGDPRPIDEKTWPGLSVFGKSVAGMVEWDNGKYYIFSTDGRYVRYDSQADRVDEGYPQPVDEKTWPGFERVKP